MLKSLALNFGTVIFKPELYIFGLEFREALPVVGSVQVLGVFFNHVGAGVSVLQKPLLKLRDFRQGIDEHP